MIGNIHYVIAITKDHDLLIERKGIIKYESDEKDTYNTVYNHDGIDDYYYGVCG